jgi:hypothetical protein
VAGRGRAADDLAPDEDLVDVVDVEAKRGKQKGDITIESQESNARAGSRGVYFAE